MVSHKMLWYFYCSIFFCLKGCLHAIYNVHNNNLTFVILKVVFLFYYMHIHYIHTHTHSHTNTAAVITMTCCCRFHRDHKSIWYILAIELEAPIWLPSIIAVYLSCVINIWFHQMQNTIKIRVFIYLLSFFLSE